MEDNNNFLMFGNYKKHFERLDGEQAKKLIMMMFEFADGEEPASNDPIVDVMFSFIKDNMVFGNKKRMASIVNGAKGGRPKKEEVTQQTSLATTKPKSKIERHPYGEFQNVRLSDEEYQKLLGVYGDYALVSQAIDILDTYMETHGKTYKNFYGLIAKGWVFESMEEMKEKFNKQNNDLRNVNIELDSEFLSDFDVVN